MTKHLKISYILAIVYFSIIIAWQSLANFFGGVGLNYVALLLIATTFMYFIATQKSVKSRFMDIFVISLIFVVLEILVYFVFEFGLGSFKTMQGFLVYQHVLSVLAMICLVYTLVRCFLELGNKKVRLFEAVLGSDKAEKKEKPAKELSNGSLEEKPNLVAEQPVATSPAYVNAEAQTVVVKPEVEE